MAAVFVHHYENWPWKQWGTAVSSLSRNTFTPFCSKMIRVSLLPRCLLKWWFGCFLGTRSLKLLGSNSQTEKLNGALIVFLVGQKAQIPLVGHWRDDKWGHRDFQLFGFQSHVFEMLRTNPNIEFMCPGGWHPSLSARRHCVPHPNSYFEAINPTIIGCDSI